MEYTYTKDWFHWAPELFTKITPGLPARRRFLEIGAFEGRGTVWMAENMLEDGGVLSVVDTWTGGEEHQEEGVAGVEERFDSNMAILKEKHPKRIISKMKMNSVSALNLLYETPQFDFIYVDGSHLAKDVLTDACMAWPCLKEGGVMVFDDYLWGDPRDVLHRPKLAVDAFLNIFAEELGILHTGYQLAVQKNGAK
ncbi:Methyltransferase domain containing protein [uncultured Caudovirales phage]|uniref:Methyltransferase domain containing protein n=1 Tax=uncultured Caudovirales phage TaxID=2100421 RepID=A0A6J5RSR9_9CAUD|nr:Methyltransferase domain containing protein [uncultured Caudovirales phage]CAB4195415.1 Methyltransferase domain containing protein [uncultured Caudovirales phage]CAB4204915.1 Methyltransferase domain containing protein [uncultured Caudovirales phage]